jgi:hypothetical protein
MHDYEYKNLEPYLVQPTLPEALKMQNASGASASAEVPKSPPSPDQDAAAQMAGELSAIRAWPRLTTALRGSSRLRPEIEKLVANIWFCMNLITQDKQRGLS